MFLKKDFFIVGEEAVIIGVLSYGGRSQLLSIFSSLDSALACEFGSLQAALKKVASFLCVSLLDVASGKFANKGDSRNYVALDISDGFHAGSVGWFRHGCGRVVGDEVDEGGWFERFDGDGV